MPKTKPAAKSSAKAPAKTVEKKVAKPAEEEKIIEIDTEEKILPDELIPGEDEGDDPEDDEAGIDDEEIDPFKDKWEE
jgi:hypothetical protein